MSTNGGNGGSGGARKHVSREEWERRMAAHGSKIRKADMNRLVMDYFVTEGHVEAARKFQAESGTEPEIDLESIRERMAVRSAVQDGRIEDAVDRVNDLNPEILDTNAGVFFRLQQQRFIELVRSGQHDAALAFAQEELAPRAEENAEFLEELERTVMLLAFEDCASSPVGDLLLPQQRQRTAAELNAAILSSQNHDTGSKLPGLLKRLLLLQQELNGKLLHPYVTVDGLTTAKLEDPPS